MDEHIVCYGDVIYVEGIFTHASDQKIRECHDQKLLYTDTVFAKRSCVLIRKNEPEYKNFTQYLYQIVGTSEISPFGSQVKFGSTFLLMPVKASRYSLCLSVNDSERADIETDTKKLDVRSTIEYADPTADPACHFRLKPTTSYRSHGPVFYSDIVSIQSVVNPSLYVHIGDNKSSYGSIDLSFIEKGYTCQIEVNASTKSEDENRGSFHWKFHFYDRLQHSILSGSVFRYGSSIRLLQSSTNKYLSCSSKPLKLRSKLSVVDDFLKMKHPFLVSYDEEEILSAKTLFRIEAVESILKGGPLTFGQSCRIRHQTSGGYLCLLYDESTPLVGPKFGLAKLPKFASRATMMQFQAVSTCQFINVTDRSDKTQIMINEPVVYLQFSYTFDRGTPHENRISFVLSSGSDIDYTVKLYPDITSDIPFPLKNSQENLSNRKSKKSRCKFLSTSNAPNSTDLIVTREFDDEDPSDEVYSSHELLKESVFTILQASDTEDHIISAVQESIPVLNDFEFVTLLLYNRHVKGQYGDMIIRPDSTNQILANLFSVKEFLKGRFDHLFDNVSVARKNSSTRHHSRSNTSYLLTDSQRQKKIYRNQILVKDCGILQRYFSLIRLPRVLGLPWSKILQNQTMKEFFTALYDVIAAVVKNNRKVLHHIARARYDYSVLASTLPRGMGIDVDAIKQNTSSKGYLREIFDQLRLHLGGVRIIKSVLTDDYEIFTNLVNKNLVSFIFNRLREGRKLLASKDIPYDDYILSLSEENLHTMSLLTNILSSRGQYCPQNQDLVLQNIYIPMKMEFFIETCLHDTIVASEGNLDDIAIESTDPSQERKISSNKPAPVPRRNSYSRRTGNQRAVVSLPQEIFITWNGLQQSILDKKNSHILQFGVENYLHDNGYVHLLDSPLQYANEYKLWSDAMEEIQYSDNYFGRRESSVDYSHMDSPKASNDKSDLIGVSRLSPDSSLPGSPIVSPKSRSSKSNRKSAADFRHYWVSLFDVIDIVNSLVPSGGTGAGSLNYVSSFRYQSGAKDKEILRLKFEMVLKNYQSTLELLTSLCESRNYECASKISEQFPFELLYFAIGTIQLPFALRSHFARLMRVLYIDRFPYVDLKLPHTYLSCKIYSDLNTTKTEPLPCWRSYQDAKVWRGSEIDSINDHNRMEHLQVTIANYFSEYFSVGLESVDQASSFTGLTTATSDNINFPSGFSFVTCSYSIKKLLVLMIRSGNYKHHSQLIGILKVMGEVIKSQTKQETNESLSKIVLSDLKDQKLKVLSSVKKKASDKSSRRKSVRNSEYILVENDDINANNEEIDEDDDESDFGYETVEDISKERLRYMCSTHDTATTAVMNDPMTIRVSVIENLVWDEQSSSRIPSTDKIARYISKDSYMESVLRGQSFDIISHSKQPSNRETGLPDLTWTWKDEWHHTPSDTTASTSDESSGKRQRIWIRHRHRKSAWDIAEELNIRGHTWYEIITAFKMFSNNNEIIDLRAAVVSLHEISLSTDMILSDNSVVSLDHVEKILTAQEFRDSDKNRLNGLYLDTCLNIIISIYDMSIHMQSSILVKSLYQIFYNAHDRENRSIGSCFIDTSHDGHRKLSHKSIELFQKALYDEKSASLDILNILSSNFLPNMISLLLNEDHSRCATAIYLLQRQFFKTKLFVNHFLKMKIFDLEHETQDPFHHSNSFEIIRGKYLRLENFTILLFKALEFHDEIMSGIFVLLDDLRGNIISQVPGDEKTAAVDKAIPTKQAALYAQLYLEMGVLDYLFQLVLTSYRHSLRIISDRDKESCKKLSDYITQFLIELVVQLNPTERFRLMIYVDDLIDMMAYHLGSVRIIHALTLNNRFMVYNTPMKKLMNQCFAILCSPSYPIISKIPDFWYYWSLCQVYQWSGKVSLYGIWENVKSSFDTHTTAVIFYANLFFSKRAKRLRNLIPGGENFTLSNYLDELQSYSQGHGGKLQLSSLAAAIPNSSDDIAVHVDQIYPTDIDPSNVLIAKEAENHLDLVSCIFTTLSLSCVGGTVDHRTVVGNKSRCRDEIPLSEIFEMLDAAVIHHHLNSIKSILLFLYAVYLEGPTSSLTLIVKEFANSTCLWNSMKKLLDLCQIFALNKENPIVPSAQGLSFEVLIVQTVLPFCSFVYYEIETAMLSDDSFQIRFTGYTAMKVKLFHLLELICMRPKEKRADEAAYTELRSILLDIQPSIEHDNGFSWTLRLEKDNDKQRLDFEVPGSNLSSKQMTATNQSSSFSKEFEQYQNSLSSHPDIVKRKEKELSQLLHAIMCQCSLMEIDSSTNLPRVISHSYEIKDVASSKKYALIHRLIRFAREEIELNLSSWPKGERRRQAIKPGDSYVEIQSIQVVFEIINGIINKYREAEGLNHIFTATHTSLTHYDHIFVHHNRLEKVISILIHANVLHLIVEAIANCCYKDIVFRAIKLFNNLSLCGGKGQIQHHLYQTLTGRTDIPSAEEIHLNGNVSYVQSLLEDVELNETAILFFDSLHDRVFLANYIRKLTGDHIQTLLEEAYGLDHEDDETEEYEASTTHLSSAQLSKNSSRMRNSVFSTTSSIPKQSGPNSNASMSVKAATSRKVETNNPSNKSAVGNDMVQVSNPKVVGKKNEAKREIIVNGINGATQNAEFMDAMACISGSLMVIKYICSNSYIPFQVFVHNDNNKLTCSLLTDIVEFLNTMLPNKKHLLILRVQDLELITLALYSIMNSISGPNTKNQMYLLTTSLFLVIKNIIEYPLEKSAIPVLNDEKTDFHVKFAAMKNLRLAAWNLLMKFIEGRLAKSDDAIFRALNEFLTMETFSRRLYVLHRHSLQHVKILSSKNHWSKKKELETIDWLVEEAFPILTLHKYLADVIPTVMRSIEPSSAKVLNSLRKEMFSIRLKEDRSTSRHRYWDEYNYGIIYKFFKTRLRSIEVQWKEREGLTRIYYRIPEQCLLLSSDDYDSIKNKLNYGEEDRVSRFFSYVDDIRNKTNHYLYLKNSKLNIIFTFQNAGDKIRLLIAIIINVVLVLTIEEVTDHRRLATTATDDHSTTETIEPHHTEFRPHGFWILVRILTIIQFILATIRFFQVIILRFPVIYASPIHQKHHHDVDPTMMAVDKASNLSEDDSAATILSSMSDSNTSNEVVGFKTVISHFSSVFFAIAASILLNGFIYIEFDLLPARLMIFLAVMIGLLFLVKLRSFAKYSAMLSTSLAYNFLHSYWVWYDTLIDHTVKYRLAFFIISCICLDMDLFYFNPLMLFIVIRMSVTMQNILKVLAYSGKSLLMIVVFIFISVLVYTMFGYIYLYDYFQHEGKNTCQTMLQCFTVFLYGGVIATGGIKDYFIIDLGSDLDPSRPTRYANRFIFDFCFFASVNILIFNGILGTIVDTFSSVRDETKEQKHFQENYCFMCNLSKDSYNLMVQNISNKSSMNQNSLSRSKNGAKGMNKDQNLANLQNIVNSKTNKMKSFNEHIFDDHNMWNYLFFLIYITNKPEAKLNNIEKYILRLWRDGDLSWIPRTETLFFQDNGVIRKGLPNEMNAEGNISNAGPITGSAFASSKESSTMTSKNAGNTSNKSSEKLK